MKKYEKVAHIITGNSDEFLESVAARIDEYQIEGLRIEVQYQHQTNKFSALILGYKEDGE